MGGDKRILVGEGIVCANQHVTNRVVGGENTPSTVVPGGCHNTPIVRRKPQTTNQRDNKDLPTNFCAIPMRRWKKRVLGLEIWEEDGRAKEKGERVPGELQFLSKHVASTRFALGSILTEVS